MEPALYIVATPIGNLGDMSSRARSVLAGVSVIAAEDTRRTGQLLNHEGIDTPMVAYHEHSPASVAASIVERIANGEAVALVSDAGTPTISDPGYRLVRDVQDRGLVVVPIPGPCAAIVALSAAGLPSDRFAFEGFLPSKTQARKRRLEALSSAAATLIFYEAPHRLIACIEDLVQAMGPEREAAIGRELTKRFETVRRGRLDELAAWVGSDADQTRGELVVMVAPAPGGAAVTLDTELATLLRGMAEHMPPRKAAKLLSAYSGIASRELYEFLSGSE